MTEVLRTAGSVAAAMKQRLPDLVVHWADAVFRSEQIAGSNVAMEFTGRKYVGQHALDGFCIAPLDARPGDHIRAEDIHSLLTQTLHQ